MSTEISFFDHVEYLSIPLREKFGLSILKDSDDPDGVVVLQNDVVKIRFFPGWPRDPYVNVSVSYADSRILESREYFELWRYANFADGADVLMPISRWHGGIRNSNYSFVGSAFQVLETIVFLATFGDPILIGNRAKLKEFLVWCDEKDREYNSRTIRRP